ncbi:MAG: hypothetical protein KGH55_03630 [Nanoarchaeota archaeon]|nr:hypothetical protein [Nanoarchaeota archaeon]
MTENKEELKCRNCGHHKNKHSEGKDFCLGKMVYGKWNKEKFCTCKKFEPEEDLEK